MQPASLAPLFLVRVRRLRALSSVPPGWLAAMMMSGLLCFRLPRSYAPRPAAAGRSQAAMAQS